MSEKDIINSFEDYKTLSQQEKDFFIFQTLVSVKGGIQALIEATSLEFMDKRYDSRYAFKRVEKHIEEIVVDVKTKVSKEEFAPIKNIVYGGIGFILIAFIGAVISLVFIK